MMDLLTCDDADTEEGDDDEASGELPCRGAATRPGTGSREHCTVGTKATQTAFAPIEYSS